jgi:hypothetical protein
VLNVHALFGRRQGRVISLRVIAPRILVEPFSTLPAAGASSSSDAPQPRAPDAAVLHAVSGSSPLSSALVEQWAIWALTRISLEIAHASVVIAVVRCALHLVDRALVTLCIQIGTTANFI